jgi:hypothetical protein
LPTRERNDAEGAELVTTFLHLQKRPCPLVRFVVGFIQQGLGVGSGVGDRRGNPLPAFRQQCDDAVGQIGLGVIARQQIHLRQRDALPFHQFGGATCQDDDAVGR